MILDLPDVLGRKVLQQWLCLASIPKLDSAFSNHELRQAFKDLAYNRATVYDSHVYDEYHGDQSVRARSLYHSWLMERKVSVSSITLVPITISPTLQQYEQYLREFGSVMTAATVYSDDPLQYLDKEVILIGRHCTGIQSLELYDCSVKEYRLVRYLLIRCSKVKNLIWSQVRYEEQLYDAFVQYCPSLHRLSIVQSDVGDRELSGILQGCPDLLYLEVSDCRMLTDDGLAKAGKYCKQLTTLVASYAGFINVKLVRLFANCPLLTTFRLSHTNFPNPEVLAALAQCPLLEEVSFNRCHGVTDDTLHVLAEHCKKLRKFRIDNSKATEHGLIALASSCPLLTTLVFDSTDHICGDASVLAVAAHCPLLVELCISMCSLVTDAAVATLAKSCPGLQSLTLNYCDNLSNAGLTAIGNHCKNLVTLEIRGHTNVSAKGLKALYYGCRNLASVTLDPDPLSCVAMATRKLYGNKLCD